uniref:WAP domain-containing protein n=1 Tax=Magallana gigas TaxID=29159 RepID=A0A8W8NAD8_MAGGI
MATKQDKRNGLCIIVVLCLVHQSLGACPLLKEEDLGLCQTPEDCCFLEPNYPIDQYGYRCFHGCTRICYIDKKNCVNPCNSVVFDIQSCVNPDPEHCDVIPNTEVVQRRECFTGCRSIWNGYSRKGIGRKSCLWRFMHQSFF